VNIKKCIITVAGLTGFVFLTILVAMYGIVFIVVGFSHMADSDVVGLAYLALGSLICVSYAVFSGWATEKVEIVWR
jgi:threonine/homoserine efflux transporter RhtA